VTNDKFDIIIAGAGMVGSCAALSLAVSGFRVGLIEPGRVDFDPVTGQHPYDERVSAISPLSRRILTDLGVWAAIDSSRVCDYDQMVVWHQNGEASIRFDSVDLARDNLGSIIENRQILVALLSACEAHADIEWFTPDAIESVIENSEIRLALKLRSGVELEADLLLAADGRSSSTATLVGLDTIGGSYDQIAIVANVKTGLPHQHTAWQRFLSSGPLAMLPLANGESSIVWSSETKLAEHLLAMDDDIFCDALGQAFEHKLGAVESVGKRLSFPLGWHSCEQWLRGRALLIGDAAHGVHPLAGQGVNLGFSDVELLVRLIGGLEKPWRRAKLRQFERQRKSQTVIATHLFSSLKWIYGKDIDALNRFRNFGMQQVQNNAWCKRLLMQQAIRNMA
jgi:2-octaprenylphenol hydroxylase